jgi:hypothetical protein
LVDRELSTRRFRYLGGQVGILLRWGFRLAFWWSVSPESLVTLESGHQGQRGAMGSETDPWKDDNRISVKVYTITSQQCISMHRTYMSRQEEQTKNKERTQTSRRGDTIAVISSDLIICKTSDFRALQHISK